MSSQEIPGYAYGQVQESAPLDMEDLEQLKETVMLTEEDHEYLRMAGEVLGDQIEDVLDVWYGFVGSHDHLLYYFCDRDGEPLDDYLSRVRQRFGQWILDTCNRPYDREWLDYQYEIAQRHYRTKKNETDSVHSAPLVHLRYMIAFIYPLTATIKPFLAKGGHSAEEVDNMYEAWFKSLVLQVTLWAQPYAREGDY